jgi:hypothetical protein
MKHWIACLAVVALFLTGCDTVNHSQIQVVPPRGEEPSRASVPISEREAVKQVITEIATKLHFEDRTAISLTPETICSFAQPDVKHPISIKAWVTKDRISIDLFQRPPEAGETLAYQRLRDQIMGELKAKFGNRLTLVHKMDQTPGGPTAGK